MLSTGCCLPELYMLCMILIWPLCRLYSMANKVSELNVEGSEETGAKAEAGKDEAGADGATLEVEGAEVGKAKDGGASDLLPLALWGPQKVTVGSSRFQQFFFT